ncbi:hypothetical protein [Aliivibrio fischeri]|nr:hypothetical protein [Aliivibrio fischeri]
MSATHRRMGVQTVMSALAIEVLLKSFNAKVTGNHGRLDETYEFNKKESLPKGSNAHDLTVLYNSLPKSVQGYLFDRSDFEIIEINKDLFTTSRYVYEQSANNIHNDDIIKLAACLICKVVYLYLKQGCDDPFIKLFDIEKLYLSQNQAIFL